MVSNVRTFVKVRRFSLGRVASPMHLSKDLPFPVLHRHGGVLTMMVNPDIIHLHLLNDLTQSEAYQPPGGGASHHDVTYTARRTSYNER